MTLSDFLYSQDKYVETSPAAKDESTRSSLGGALTLLTFPLITMYTIFFILNFTGNDGKAMPTTTGTVVWPFDGSDTVTVRFRCIAPGGCWVRPQAKGEVTKPTPGAAPQSTCYWFNKGDYLDNDRSLLYFDSDPVNAMTVLWQAICYL
jgi:hypothetical protein